MADDVVEFRFRGGEKAIEEEIKRQAGQPETGEELGKTLHELVERGKDYAESISPDATGTLKDAWAVEDFAPRSEGDPPMSQLQNSNDAAEWIEYGTKDTPPHAVLASTQSSTCRASRKTSTTSRQHTHPWGHTAAILLNGGSVAVKATPRRGRPWAEP